MLPAQTGVYRAGVQDHQKGPDEEFRRKCGLEEEIAYV